MMKALRWVAAHWILLAAGFIGAVIVVGVLLPDKPEPVDADDAVAACRGFVEARLKAPSTAEFGTARAAGSAPAWTVRGTVTAENSFGVPLEMDYTCTVRLDGNVFRLESLDGLT